MKAITPTLSHWTWKTEDYFGVHLAQRGKPIDQLEEGNSEMEKLPR